jgi:hypothetical protein
MQKVRETPPISTNKPGMVVHACDPREVLVGKWWSRPD